MNNEAVRQYYNPAPTLTPIYIEAGLLATLQKEERLAEHIAVSSRTAEKSLLEHCVSIATIHHSPPTYQAHVEATSSTVNTVVNPPKRVTIFERIATDLDARFSKSDLKSKAEKATSDFLNAMALDSQTDTATAVGCFDISMREIFAVIDNFKASTLGPGIKKEIFASLQKLVAEKFLSSGASVNSATVEKVKAILDVADQSTAGQPDSTATPTSRTMANQILKILQEKLFANLENQAEQMIKDLLAAADPESRTTITTASKVFDNKMKAISAQREHLKNHDLHKDFAKNINTSLNRGANVYSADVAKGNLADWKAKSKKLSEETGTVADETYPKDIYTAQQRLSLQLGWMKEEDFSNQIKASIKQIFPKRYEFIVTTEIGNTKGVNNITAFSINRLKKDLQKKCIAKDNQEITKQIQKNRKNLTLLLMADDGRRINVNEDINSLTIAVNKYLESNETELDFAIAGMFLDHIKNMEQRELMKYS